MKIQKWEKEALVKRLEEAREAADGPSGDAEIDAWQAFGSEMDAVLERAAERKRDNRGLAVIRSMRRDVRKYFKQAAAPDTETRRIGERGLQYMSHGLSQSYVVSEYTLAGGGPGVTIIVTQYEDGEVKRVEVEASDAVGVDRKTLTPSDPLYQLGEHLIGVY